MYTVRPSTSSAFSLFLSKLALCPGAIGSVIYDLQSRTCFVVFCLVRCCQTQMLEIIFEAPPPTGENGVSPTRLTNTMLIQVRRLGLREVI